MKNHTLALALVVALSAPSIAAAGARGIRRDFDLTYETRSTDRVDISRWTLTTNWQWDVTRRSQLAVSVPFGASTLENKTNGLSSDVSGLKDVTVDYRLEVRPLQGNRPGLFYKTSLSLPTGQATLGTAEQAVINAINDAAEGFYNPEYGRGFGLSLGAGWSFRQGGNGKLELSAGYRLRGSFDPSAGFSRDDSDILYVDVHSLRQVTPRRTVSLGFNVQYFTDGSLTDDTLNLERTVERDPDILFSYGLKSTVNPGMKRDLVFVYTLRGTQDFVDAGGTTVTPGTELGDRVNLDFTFHRRLTPVNWLDYGLSYLKTMSSSVEGGGTVFDTARDDLRLVVGTTREMNTGFQLKGALEVGLTDDARDLVVRAGGVWDF